MKFFTALLFVLGMFSSVSRAQDYNDINVSGYVFGDYFYKVDGDSSGSGSQYSNLNKDVQGLELRRVYLTFKKNISKDFSANVTLEGNSGINTGGRYGVILKVVQLTWKNLIPLGQVNIGIIPSNTFDIEQDIWSYRSIEKTVGDFRGFGNATDAGISITGNFDGEGKFGYATMFAMGTGQRTTFSKNKKYIGQLSTKPVKGLTVAAYGDYEATGEGVNTTTIKGTAGYNSPQFNIGGSVYLVNRQAPNVTDVKPFAFSVFAWAPITTSKNLTVKAFARFDNYDPDTENTTSGFKQNFITAGLDFMPVKNVHIMPNVWVNTFSDKSSMGIERPTDMVARMTFYYKYE